MTNDEIIALCESVGIKWLEPDRQSDGSLDPYGFPGSFDMATMAEMRELIERVKS